MVTIKWCNRSTPDNIMTGTTMTKAEAKKFVEKQNEDLPHLKFWYE